MNAKLASTTKRIAQALLAGTALAAMMAAPSVAQDTPSPPLIVEPATVDSAGETLEFRVSGEQWDYPKVGIIPCGYPESGDLTDIDPATCNISAIVEHIPENGSFDITVSYQVPEGGLAIVVTSADDPVSPSAANAVLIPIVDQAQDTQAELANTGYRTNLVVTAGLVLSAIGVLAFVLRKGVVGLTNP